MNRMVTKALNATQAQMRCTKTAAGWRDGNLPRRLNQVAHVCHLSHMKLELAQLRRHEAMALHTVALAEARLAQVRRKVALEEVSREEKDLLGKVSDSEPLPPWAFGNAPGKAPAAAGTKAPTWTAGALALAEGLRNCRERKEALLSGMPVPARRLPAPADVALPENTGLPCAATAQHADRLHALGEQVNQAYGDLMRRPSPFGLGHPITQSEAEAECAWRGQLNSSIDRICSDFEALCAELRNVSDTLREYLPDPA